MQLGIYKQKRQPPESKLPIRSGDFAIRCELYLKEFLILVCITVHIPKNLYRNLLATVSATIKISKRSRVYFSWNWMSAGSNSQSSDVDASPAVRS